MTVLVFSDTIGPRTDAFATAAASIDLDLLVVVDAERSSVDSLDALESSSRYRAIAVRYEDEEASVRDVLAALRGSHEHARQAVAGVVAADDRAAVLTARVAQELGIAWHPVQGVRVSQSPLMMRGRLLAIELPTPWFFTAPIDTTVDAIADRLRFPCVIAPLDRAGHAAAIPATATRVDTVEAFEAALDRVRRHASSGAVAEVLIEAFIDGQGYAIEGVLEQGALRVFAIADLTAAGDGRDGAASDVGSRVATPRQGSGSTAAALSTQSARRIAGTMAYAAAATGLRHGPIHGECRVNEAGVFVLTIAPRSGDEPAARALRFATATRSGITLEELILRHAIGESLDGYGREAAADS